MPIYYYEDFERKHGVIPSELKEIANQWQVDRYSFDLMENGNLENPFIAIENSSMYLGGIWRGIYEDFEHTFGLDIEPKELRNRLKNILEAVGEGELSPEEAQMQVRELGKLVKDEILKEIFEQVQINKFGDIEFPAVFEIKDDGSLGQILYWGKEAMDFRKKMLLGAELLEKQIALRQQEQGLEL